MKDVEGDSFYILLFPCSSLVDSNTGVQYVTLPHQWWQRGEPYAIYVCKFFDGYQYGFSFYCHMYRYQSSSIEYFKESYQFILLIKSRNGNISRGSSPIWYKNRSRETRIWRCTGNRPSIRYFLGNDLRWNEKPRRLGCSKTKNRFNLRKWGRNLRSRDGCHCRRGELWDRRYSQTWWQR